MKAPVVEGLLAVGELSGPASRSRSAWRPHPDGKFQIPGLSRKGSTSSRTSGS